jgi:hypothetical protein
MKSAAIGVNVMTFHHNIEDYTYEMRGVATLIEEGETGQYDLFEYDPMDDTNNAYQFYGKKIGENEYIFSAWVS